MFWFWHQTDFWPPIYYRNYKNSKTNMYRAIEHTSLVSKTLFSVTSYGPPQYFMFLLKLPIYVSMNWWLCLQHWHHPVRGPKWNLKALILLKKEQAEAQQHTRDEGSSSQTTHIEKCPYKSIRISILPLSCGSDPVNLTSVETVTPLMEVGLYTFLLKLVELLPILVAQKELWWRRDRDVN